MSAAAGQWMAQKLLGYAIGMAPSYQVSNWHRYLAKKLEAVERGEIRRLIITVPPKHGKSMLSSEFFPAWCIGRNPWLQMIHVTYGQELSDSFGRKVRNQLNDDAFALAFPDCHLSQDSQSAKAFATKEGGAYVAVGAGGAVTGKGAHILLIDDPIKNRQDAESKTIRTNLLDFYKSTAFTRLMPYKGGPGAVVLIQTRWHPEDLAGWLLANEADDWEVVNLPALAEENDVLGRQVGEPLWPEQFSKEDLERIRYTIGEKEFGSLYQQRPVPASGNLVKREWFRYDKTPSGAPVTLGVDLAISEKETADYTAIAAIARDAYGKVYVKDVVRDRLSFHAVLNLIEQMAYKHNAQSVAIEQVQFQAAVIQELLRTTTLPIRGIKPERDKVSRFQPLLVRYEQGLVIHDELPAWFEDELLTFPAGEHDDIVDACSYAFMAHEGLSGNRPLITDTNVFADSDIGY